MVLVVVTLVDIMDVGMVLVVVALVNVVHVSGLVAVVFMLVALMGVVLVSVVLVSVALVNFVWHLYLRMTTKLGCFASVGIIAQIEGNSKQMTCFIADNVLQGSKAGNSQILSFNSCARKYG